MKKKLLRILIVEDNIDHSELLTRVIERHFAPVDLHTVESMDDAMDFVEQTGYDMILTDCYIAGLSIADQIPFLKNRAGNAPILVITGSGDESVAADVIKKGATDYIVKTKDSLEKIPGMINKYLQKGKRPSEGSVDHTPLHEKIMDEVNNLGRQAKHMSHGSNRIPDVNQLEDLLEQIQRLKEIASKIKK